ncbi:hypothetical protein Bca52824_007005 [Brassica carinata]|uniref:RRM domain-containing protein n=1 Tax=Brassica carinata TaxID=52824 RepID=A0A8X8B7H4_BRACI|nr:hypothetical protein Bca52824_007005 [Brassica carinata]
MSIHQSRHGKFSTFGNIVSCKVAVDASGQVKRLWGFCNTCRYAQKATEKLNGMLLNDKQVAVESLNGHKFDDKEWYVGRAQKKSERETELRVRYEQYLKEAAEKFQSSNLYVKNLDPNISDEKLKEMFF